MTDTIKSIFDGASGLRAVIYVALFMSSLFGLYYGMQSAVVKAQATGDANTADIDKLVGVIKTQNDRQIAVERKQAILEYQLEQDTKMNEKQSDQLAHQTKVLERIAAKLQVRTD